MEPEKQDCESQKPRYVPSRYLRNPVSSCHDHCKTKHPPFSLTAHSSRQASKYKKKSKLDEKTSVSGLKSTPNSEKCKRVRSKVDLSEKKVMKGGPSLKPSRSSSFKDCSQKSVSKPRNRYEDSPRNLQFRRGKVIEAKPECSNVRRLHFRKMRLADDIQRVSGDTRRRYIRRTEANAAEIKNPKSEKILLRHRSMEKRKKNQSLLNNVIEETASKLAVSRKSKVKALVGAFETVISLQESKQRKV